MSHDDTPLSARGSRRHVGRDAAALGQTAYGGEATALNADLRSGKTGAGGSSSTASSSLADLTVRLLGLHGGAASLQTSATCRGIDVVVASSHSDITCGWPRRDAAPRRGEAPGLRWGRRRRLGACL